MRLRYRRILFCLCLSLLFGTSVGCEPTCFVSGTLVETSGGPVEIQSLTKGSRVIAIDPSTGVVTEAVVLSNKVSSASSYLKISTSDGADVEVTRHHQFWTGVETGYRPIGDLGVGDKLWKWTGQAMVSVRIIDIKRMDRKARVYHLMIDRHPNTFLANSLVVHNKGVELVEPQPDASVSMIVQPGDAGWIRVVAELFVGQGGDTVLHLFSGSIYDIEAVPRVGWSFDHWEGAVSEPDSFVTRITVEDGLRVRCVFSTVP